MTTIRQRNGHLPHRHHSRLSLEWRRQALTFARMLEKLPPGVYTITVTREPRGFRFEPVAVRAVEGEVRDE